MNDNEIIKALKCCGNDECSKCPLQDGVCSEKDIMKQALDLINRQKAEAERLNKKVEELSEVLSDSIKIKVSEIKSETIREFVERLKNEIISNTAYGCDTNQHSGYYDYSIKVSDIPEYIDNLVKEMVGENNG